MFVKKEEVPKRHYSPKAKGSNVRGVGTFFVTPTKTLNNGYKSQFFRLIGARLQIIILYGKLLFLQPKVQ